MASLPRFLHLGLVLGCLAAAACEYPRNEPGTANGEDNVLSFSGGSSLLVPVHATRTIEVARLPGGKVDCHPLGIKREGAAGTGVEASATGPHLAGGGHPDLPSDTCDSVPADPITLESAACDDDACTISSEANAGRVVLHLVAEKAGATHLRVNVKSSKDGARYSDSIPVRFAEATRVRLRGTADGLLPLTLPALAGLSMSFPTADVVDAEGEVMSLDEGALVRTLRGDAWVEEDSYGMVASKPGHSTLHWEVPGVVARDVDLEVVSPASATALEVLPEETEAQAGTDEGTLDLDALPTATSEAPLTSIDVASTVYSGAMFPTRVVLDDGRRALAKVVNVSVEPTVFGTAHPSYHLDWALQLEKLPAVGEGTITVRAGTLAVTLPLRVGPPTKKP